MPNTMGKCETISWHWSFGSQTQQFFNMNSVWVYVWSSLHTLHTTYVLCITISFLNSSLIFMQLCVVCIAVCSLFNNLHYIQPFFCIVLCFHVTMCSLHSNPLLTSGIMVFTHYLHSWSFVLLARIPFRYVHLSFFCWHVLSLLSSWFCVFIFYCMNFFNVWFFSWFLFWLFIVLLSSVCNCLELAMDTKEHIWEWLSSSLKQCNMFGKKTIHFQQFFFQHLVMRGKSWYSFYDCCFA
jgi:hypothetical protein